MKKIKNIKAQQKFDILIKKCMGVSKVEVLMFSLNIVEQPLLNIPSSQDS